MTCFLIYSLTLLHLFSHTGLSWLPLNISACYCKEKKHLYLNNAQFNIKASSTEPVLHAGFPPPPFMRHLCAT